MFHELASHNEDIKRLLEVGYAITEDHGYLVIRDIPYLDNNGAQQNGAIVTKLVWTGRFIATSYIPAPLLNKKLLSQETARRCVSFSVRTSDSSLP